MRQQQFEIAVPQRGQALEHILEIGPRIVPVEFGRFDQAEHHGGTLAGLLGTHEYCKARQRLALRLPQRLRKHLGMQMERCTAAQWGWHARPVKLFDVTTVSMPDTPQNQQKWPQSGRQKPGLGFPLARIGALISLSSGAVIDYAVGPMKGKFSGEQALLRELSGRLSRNDLLLADALHSTWWAVRMLVQRGVDVVMPNDGRRKVDFTEGCVHNESDHVVWWPKPKRASCIGKTDYEQMPAGLWVREVRVDCNIPLSGCASLALSRRAPA